MSSTGKTVALVLAGGESRRMGQPKLLLRRHGVTLLERAMAAAAETCDEVLVVVGAHQANYRPIAEAAGARVIANPDWREGLASSLRSGMAALPEHTERLLIVLPDQPQVDARHLRALLDEQAHSGAALVFSRYAPPTSSESTPDAPGAGVLGAPAVIARPLFAAVLRLRGDRGARALQGAAVAHGGISEVPLAFPGDVDTPDDARRLGLDPLEPEDPPEQQGS